MYHIHTSDIIHIPYTDSNPNRLLFVLKHPWITQLNPLMQVVIESESATKYGFPHRTDKAALKARCTNKATEVHRNVRVYVYIYIYISMNSASTIEGELFTSHQFRFGVLNHVRLRCSADFSCTCLAHMSLNTLSFCHWHVVTTLHLPKEMHVFVQQ